MKNFQKSENLKSFNEKRNTLQPYGLTCEKWKPNSMKQFDRHNEIELNFLTAGHITYLMQDKKIIIPSCKLTVFWGLVPHQIIDYTEEDSFYYVCTIPFAQFLKWNLPEEFINKILCGEVLVDPNELFTPHDLFYFEHWFNDLSKGDKNSAATELEIESRLIRMSNNITSKDLSTNRPIHIEKTNLLEQICIYIAKNYERPIKVSDIAKAVGLHPDYANSIFKKAFGHTLSNHLIMERITHAQRKLLLTDRNILDIAYECGFNSISNFNQTFFNFNGCTPREYRRQYK